MADLVDPSAGDGGGSPRRRERGRMRRRLRRQQRVREALLLDLGALVYELHRQGRREPELLQAKAAELSAVDDEVRALGEALEERQPLRGPPGGGPSRNASRSASWWRPASRAAARPAAPCSRATPASALTAVHRPVPAS